MSLFLTFDTKQTLYMWRNSNPNLAENLDCLLTGTKTGFIQKNYRSPEKLVQLANKFAASFEDHAIEVQESVPHKLGDSEVLLFEEFETTNQEMNWIGERISELSERDVPWKDIAVLCRTNRMLLNVEASLIARGVPYKVKYDSRSMLNQSPFKFVVAIYSLLVNPWDIEALAELIKGVQGLGVKYVDRVVSQIALLRGRDPESSILDESESLYRLLPENQQTAKFRALVDSFLKPLKVVLQGMQQNLDFEMLNLLMARKMKDLFVFGGDYDPQADLKVGFKREQMTKVFGVLGQMYQILGEEIEFNLLTLEDRFKKALQRLHVSHTPGESSENQVNLTTVHGFKGNESPHIFYSNLRSYREVFLSDFEASCVFYVGVTRATEKLYLTSARNTYSEAGKSIRSKPNHLLTEYLRGLET